MPKRLFAVLLMIGALAQPGVASAAGASEASAGASVVSILSAASVAYGADTLVNGSGRFLVTSLETVGHSTTIVLRDASAAAQASVTLLKSAADAASLGIGTVVTVVAQASGHLLVASGQAIAFIPNQIGNALLGSARTRERQ